MALEVVWKEEFYGQTDGDVVYGYFETYQEAVDKMKTESLREHFVEFSIKKRFRKDYRNVEPQPEPEPTISAVATELAKMISAELANLYSRR